MQARPEFSICTGSPVAAASLSLISTSRQPRAGAFRIMAGALVHHAGNNDANTFAIGLSTVCFQHSANSHRKILDKFRNTENRIVSFKRELLVPEKSQSIR